MWGFYVCCQPYQSVEETNELPVIWDRQLTHVGEKKQVSFKKEVGARVN